MKRIMCVLVLLASCAACVGAEIDKPTEAALLAEIVSLRQELQLVKDELARVKAEKGRTDGPPIGVQLPEEWPNRVPPMVDVQQRVAGSWVFHPQTAMLVRTRSIYHSWRRGKANYVELIELEGRPIPVDTVIFGENPSGGGNGNGNGGNGGAPPVNFNLGGQAQFPEGF